MCNWWRNFFTYYKRKFINVIKSNKEKILNLIDLIQNSYISNPILDSNSIFKALDAILLLGKKLGSQVLLFSASNIISNLNLMLSTIKI